MLVAILALVVATAGTAIAAHHYVITSTKQIAPKVLKQLRGRTGRPGAAGAAGAAGTPGTARAFAHVLVGGATGGIIDTTRDHRGIVSVRTTPTYFCVKLDPSINASQAVAVVSVDFPESGFSFSAPGTMGFAGTFLTLTCDQGNEIGVATGSYGASQNGGFPVEGPGPFSIVVP
jgi:hypothetical protein